MQDIIDGISERILSEFNKHKEIDWHVIAAVKIAHTYIEPALKKQRAEFVKELEGMDMKELDIREPLWGEWANGVYDGKNIANEIWRKKRDTLINKYKP